MATVKTHVHLTISKLRVSDHTQAAVYAIRIGLAPGALIHTAANRVDGVEFDNRTPEDLRRAGTKRGGRFLREPAPCHCRKRPATRAGAVIR